MVNYRGNEAGYLVIPMRAFPAWEVRINDTKVSPETFLEILPAIYVTGSSKLVIKYRPFRNLMDYFLKWPHFSGHSV
jgi:hypothetical protein